jgi:MoxR-like ATPase
MKVLSTRNRVNVDPRLEQILAQANSVVYGKPTEMKLALATFLADGHLLVEDVPGVGKTTFVTCLSHLLGLKMNRIQFTNDLLPADVLGASIYNEDSRDFTFHPGPIFSELVLGDELNRANPKTQSAFLQAMEERRVSVDGVSRELPEPFLIVCTQNPQTQIGTYPLPESQLDRFMVRLSLGYPDADSELAMLSTENPRNRVSKLKPVLDARSFMELQQKSQQINVALRVVKYVQSLLAHSRSTGAGLSPRAGILILQAARSWAFLEGRDFVLPEDIQTLAPFVFNHRLPQSPQLNAAQLLKSVAIP